MASAINQAPNREFIADLKYLDTPNLNLKYRQVPKLLIFESFLPIKHTQQSSPLIIKSYLLIT